MNRQLSSYPYHRQAPDFQRNRELLNTYGYRDYDPQIGRWTGRDPLGEFGGSNLYNLLSDQIIDYVDYLGLVDWEFWKTVLIEVGNDLADPKAHWKAIKFSRPGFGKRDPRALREVCDNNNITTTNRTKPKANHGDCTPAEHAALNADVGAACKGPSFSCAKSKHPNLCCDEIKIRIGLATACAVAREAMNNKCYKGKPDPTHQQEAENARKAAQTCTKRYASECNKK